MYSSTNDVRTIWITGGAGFLGRRLTRELSGKGCKVVSLSRRTSPHADESIAIDLVSGAHKLQQLLDAEGPPDVVVHAAAGKPWRWMFGSLIGVEPPPPGVGFSLAAVYGCWLVGVILLYPLCKWFAGVKARRRDWWLSYL